MNSLLDIFFRIVIVAFVGWWFWWTGAKFFESVNIGQQQWEEERILCQPYEHKTLQELPMDCLNYFGI